MVAISPNDPQIDPVAARASPMIRKAREIASETLGKDAAKNVAADLCIASLPMPRKAAQSIGFELAAEPRKGK